MRHTATYSPEDNKLRLYPACRLGSDEYAKVKACGFKWAPMQKLFVAPMWTPEREDLLIDMCGEIEDEDKSLVDRQEERAERFEEYSDNRKRDSESAHEAVSRIADGIPLGQPILVGHHSERRARKDAERIQNGMRKAVKMWDLSQYWKDRAKGAIAHAKYKELPGVRARRIKGLEADLRRCIASYTPKNPNQVVMQQKWSEVYPLNGQGNPDAPEKPHVYCGGGSRGGSWVAVEDLPRIKARMSRWEDHYSNRLEYEHAMLEEQGASDLLEKPKRPAPLPLCNYRLPDGIKIENEYHKGEFIHYEQVECTKAQLAKIPTDYKGTRIIGNSHRVRIAYGRYFGRTGYGYCVVFLTDSKVHTPPDAVEPKAKPLPPAPTPEQIEKLRARNDAREIAKVEAAPFEAMRESLRAGVAVVSAPQLFPTPPEVVKRMLDLAAIEPGETVLEPSAGTGAIVREIVNTVDTEIVGYEINSALCSKLTAIFPSYRLQARRADFLEVTEGQGCFPKVVMNPPFENGSDIKHILHARKFLRPGGRLVAICANGPRQQEQLQPLCDSWEELPAGTFAGTSVRAVLLTMGAE